MACVCFCFRGKENLAIHGICGKIWNHEGKFCDAASLLLVKLCTPARWHFLRLVPGVAWLYLTLMMAYQLSLSLSPTMVPVAGCSF
jgi:hypothetical protein